MSASFKVKLLPDEYYLSKPIHISPVLSSLSISGSGVDETIIKGSKLFSTSWEKFRDNIFVADVKSDMKIDQLYFGGEKQYLARHPNYDESGGHWQGHAEDVISPDRLKTWGNPVGSIVHITHKGEWGDFHYVIEGIDENGKLFCEADFRTIDLKTDYIKSIEW